MKKQNKPNINVPEGFDLYFNTFTGNWAFRPIKGFSDKYLTKDCFVPNRVKENELFDTSKSIENRNGNSNLTKAKKEKNDEFYTRLEDITSELKHYKEFFRDKIIYCPCDKLFNIGFSNFGRYFISQFQELGIKKLICTQWNPNGAGLVKEYDFTGHGFKWVYNGEEIDKDKIDESNINIYFLDGDGSFDSDECKKIMKECDVVITNPPFSLFRKFVEQIIECNKKFLIVGNENAITYKEIFPYIKNNKIWLGYGKPKAYETTLTKIEDEKTQFEEGGVIYQRFGNHCWFTNIEHSKRKEEIPLKKNYNLNEYPKYDNYDAINVDRVDNIPYYDGVMGVPISFLNKYCPSQFEIVGGYNYSKDYDGNTWNGKINGKYVYKRLLIRRRL